MLDRKRKITLKDIIRNMTEDMPCYVLFMMKIKNHPNEPFYIEKYNSKICKNKEEEMNVYDKDFKENSLLKEILFDEDCMIMMLENDEQ